MSKKRKPKIEFRYYKMPEGSPILALLGQKWVQSYGRDVDYLHFHNYLEIGYCYAGEGTLTLGERDYRFTGGEISVIPRNYPHTTNSDPGTVSKWEYLFVDVDGLLEELYQKGGNVKRMKYLQNRINSQAIFRAIEDAPGIAKMIRGILDVMRETKEFYLEEAKGMMVALLVCIARENPDEKGPVEISGKVTIPVSRALDYITLHYMEPLKVEELARWCHISETHFRRVFSEYMKMSPVKYINQVRIRHVCDELTKTNDSINAIAARTGFPSLSTFNRNFRQITGLSPQQFRKHPELYTPNLPSTPPQP